jgi:hypothetical protein
MGDTSGGSDSSAAGKSPTSRVGATSSPSSRRQRTSASTVSGFPARTKPICDVIGAYCSLSSVRIRLFLPRERVCR